MPDRPLWQFSATELAARIADGSVSSLEAVRSAIDRMREKNPSLNAVVDDLSDDALKAAEELDRLFSQSGPVGELHGVPVTIKENTDQKGRPASNGVVAFKDVVAPDDAPIVRSFKKAGAIIIGRTNTPEFSFRATTVNELHGRTYNPWNDWATSGGSSGGAASAVMSGMGALAQGNDLAGSLRFPAAATGAATIKPGFARTATYNPSATADFGMLTQVALAQGVIAREVRDLRLTMNTLIRYDPHDPWMVPMPFAGEPLAGPIKLAFTKNTFEFDLHPAVDRALDAARDALSDAGYVITETDPPDLRAVARDMWRTVLGEVDLLEGADMRKYGSETFKRVYQDYSEVFEPYRGDELLRAMARRSHYVREWLLFLQDYPLVLTPFMPVPTLAWDRDAQGPEGVREVLGEAIYSGSINYLGLPAGNVPANYNDGLPVGVQIVGRRFREDLILDACEAIESRVGVMANRLFERG